MLFRSPESSWDMIELMSRWAQVWGEVEDHVLAAWRALYHPMTQEKMNYTLKLIQEGTRQGPIEKTMQEFLPSLAIDASVVPTINELIQEIFPPSFKNQLQAELKKSDEAGKSFVKANEQSFEAYSALSRKGVAWPHSPERRRLWEAGGFEFRPMLFKRDRMVCSVCEPAPKKDGICGIESWMYPQDYHIAAQHPAGYLEGLAFNGVPLIRETYGENIPPDDGTRALVEYLIRHIDVYARDLADRSMVDSTLDKQAVELAKFWVEIRTWVASAPGLIRFARYV